MEDKSREDRVAKRGIVGLDAAADPAVGDLLETLLRSAAKEGPGMELSAAL